MYSLCVVAGVQYTCVLTHCIEERNYLKCNLFVTISLIIYLLVQSVRCTTYNVQCTSNQRWFNNNKICRTIYTTNRTLCELIVYHTICTRTIWSNCFKFFIGNHTKIISFLLRKFYRKKTTLTLNGMQDLLSTTTRTILELQYRTILKLYQNYIRIILELYQNYSRIILENYILELYQNYIRTILELYQNYSVEQQNQTKVSKNLFII